MRRNWAGFGAATLVIVSFLLTSCSLGGPPFVNPPAGRSSSPKVRGAEFYKFPGRPGGSPPEVTFMLGTGLPPLSSGPMAEGGIHIPKGSMARPKQARFQPGTSPLHVAPVRLAEEPEVQMGSREISEPPRQDRQNLQQVDSSIAIAPVRLPETAEAYLRLKDLSNAPVQDSSVFQLGHGSLAMPPVRLPVISEAQVVEGKVSKLPRQDTPDLQLVDRSIGINPVRLPSTSEAHHRLKALPDTPMQDSPLLQPGDRSPTVSPARLPGKFEPQVMSREVSQLHVRDTPDFQPAELQLAAGPAKLPKESDVEVILTGGLDSPVLLPQDSSLAVARVELSEEFKVQGGSSEESDPLLREIRNSLLADDSFANSTVRYSEILEAEVNSQEGSTPSLQETPNLQQTDTPLFAALVKIPDVSEAQVGSREVSVTPVLETPIVPQADNPLTTGPHKSHEVPVRLASTKNIAPVPVPMSPMRSSGEPGVSPSPAMAGPGPMQIVVGEPRNSRPAMTPVAAVPVPPQVPESPPAESGLVVRERLNELPGLDVRISVDLRQMDILAVMKFLAKEGNLNIVTGKNVGGRISLTLKDVTVRDILDIIALSYELAYVVQNGIFYVMTAADYSRLFGASFADQRKVRTLQLEHADANAVAAILNNMKSAVGRVIGDPQTRTLVLIDVPEKLAPMVAAAESMDQATKQQTQVFELSYGKAEDIQPEVEKVLTPNLGSVRLDKRTNTLVVSDLASRMNDVQRVIRAFDRKTREVNIEAKIVQVRLDDKYQMGVNWEVLFQQLSDLRLQATFPISPPVGPLGPVGKITVGTLADDDFTAVIELLQTVGKTNVLSTPQIAVVENEEAKILVGTREAFVTSVVTQTQQAATTAEDVTFIDVGVSLTVTPTINREGYVTMKIKPEVSSVTRTLTTASGNQIPIVQTSSAETTVMVKDGVTIIIAGLIEDQTLETHKKVPILGDIPFLGAAFRSKEDEVIKSEIVIFLTPTIISGKDSIASTTPAAP